MLLALEPKTNKRVKAMPGMQAICPGCEEKVIARCGNIKIWHWAHKSGLCKYDSEPETEWHLEWKNNALKMGMEIEKIFDPFQRFRADIYDPKRNMVTEVDRSSFYDSKGIKIRWIFDFIDRYESMKIYLHVGILGMEFKQKYQNKHIYCLFDEYGFPKYDTNLNIGIDYDKHTNSTLKIGRIDKANGSGYGKLFSSMIVEEKFDIPSWALSKDYMDIDLVKIDNNKYIRKNGEIICNVQEEITIMKSILVR